MPVVPADRGGEADVFLPGQGGAVAFKPEHIEQLIRKLTALGLSFAPYSRPKASLPIRVSLPAGLRSPTPKPATVPLPSPPSLASRPAIKPLPPAPAAPPRPELKLVPKPPVHPARPSLPPSSPPDNFLDWLCFVGLLAGAFIIVIAPPVGFIILVGFAIWWGLLLATEKLRLRKNS